MTLQPLPEVPSADQIQPERTTLAPAATLTSLGKRTRDSQSDYNAQQLTRETNGSENDLGRRARPEKKRARDGTERIVLKEKDITSKPSEEAHPIQGEETGESAGTSTSGPSSQPPSIGTPPPAHGSDAFLDEAALLELCHAGSTVPRGDMFPQYMQTEEPFSPGSALKATAVVPNESAQRLNVMPSDFEPRRISTAAARPRTPTRSLGHERFRIAVDTNVANAAPGREILRQPFNFDEGAYNYQYDFSNTANGATYFFPRRDVVNNNGQTHDISPPTMPLAVGYGLAAHALTEESPIRGPATTMYGTEIQNDTRFGDFGRDGLASGSALNFWGTF